MASRSYHAIACCAPNAFDRPAMGLDQLVAGIQSAAACRLGYAIHREIEANSVRVFDELHRAVCRVQISLTVSISSGCIGRGFGLE